ncbi:MAG TPA: zf-HC2 domain-containing protein [Kofleriaceae bacterium]|nr:zf-HC2 domain-containing protein [Kofleriaceae bacterium]
MKPLCENIETLAMTFLDGELAGGEARELELHLVDCGPCRAQVEQAADEPERRRRLLAPPPPPELLRARVLRTLDDEDRRRRRPLTAWVLPGGAALAAVAALAVFVGLPRSAPAGAAVDKEAVAAVTRNRPLEVRGPAVEPWVRANFDGGVMLPTFYGGDVKSVGARISRVLDRDAAALNYQVDLGGDLVEVDMFVLDAHGLPFRGEKRNVGGRTLWLSQADGWSIVKLRDRAERAFVFVSAGLDVDELADLVGQTSLIRQMEERR